MTFDRSNILMLSNDTCSYSNRLKAVNEMKLQNLKVIDQGFVSRLYKMMRSDKVFKVREAAHRALQSIGEDAHLPKNKKGDLYKDIGNVIKKIHNSFTDPYTLESFKTSFQRIEPQIYDAYNGNKQTMFDDWLKNVIKSQCNNIL